MFGHNFDDYTGTIEKGPRSSYQITGQSVSAGVVNPPGPSFLSRLNRASEGGFLKVGSNQTFQAQGNENQTPNTEEEH